jgi:hypothetical protein
MKIQLQFGPTVDSAQPGFTDAFTFAATELGGLLTNPGTVTIHVENMYTSRITPGPGRSAGGPSGGITLTYDNLVAELRANADSQVDQQVLATLPTTAPAPGTTYYITPAQEKAWGILPPEANGIDGYITIGSGGPFTTDPNARVVDGKLDLIGIAELEITHVLGRGSALTSYSAPGVLATSEARYFSIDGGKTNLATYGVYPADPADFNDARLPDHRDGGYFITPLDKTLMDASGFSTNPNAAKNYRIVDTTTGIAHYTNGAPYPANGPVSGLTSEVILANAGDTNIGDTGLGSRDNFNITASTPNSFIHTGIGMDAIDVSAAGGSNILDGGGGSNFLTGGAYVAGSPDHDIFYLDDRNPSGNLWSTIVNFHTGDQATVWGVNEKDFKLDWLPDQGAAGFTGLDAVFSAAGHPAAALTLTGYGFAQLHDGSLQVAYGRTGDLPGIPGSDYMTITGSAHFGS